MARYQAQSWRCYFMAQAWCKLPLMAGLILVAATTAHAASTAPPAAGADLESIIKAAKAEGELTFYTAATNNVAKRIADAFSAKYGIKTQFVRLSTAPITQRYFAEAETGNIAADLVITAGDRGAPFTTDAVKKGWMEPLSASNLPIFRSGEFPAKFNLGDTAVISVSPWSIVYNTDRIKGADVPKDWTDVLNPKWKGQIVLADPRVGTVFYRAVDRAAR